MSGPSLQLSISHPGSLRTQEARRQQPLPVSTAEPTEPQADRIASPDGFELGFGPGSHV
jgi:hypothetical protein